MILQEKLGNENFSKNIFLKKLDRQKIWKEKFLRGKMKKYCIRKLFEVNFKEALLSTKKEQDKQIVKKNFILETFNEEFFLKVNIF